MKKKLLKTFLILLSLGFASSFTPTPVTAYGTGFTFDYELFQQFLDQYTEKDVQIGEFKLTAVNYDRINREKNRPDSLYGKLLNHFNSINLSGFSARNEQIAFWINAYNFAAIKMIIDHYPVDSIRDRKINFFKNPWNIKIITIGGSEYALGQIEHTILLGQLAEPMAHFGVVCASLSCPNLNTEVYRPEKVMGQLAHMAKAFLVDRQKGLVINRSKNQVSFSKIFKFDKKTFPNGAESAIKIFADHFEPTDLQYLKNSRYSLDYLEYDWSLNRADK